MYRSHRTVRGIGGSTTARWPALSVLLAAMPLVLAACGGDDDTNGDATSAEPTGAAESEDGGDIESLATNPDERDYDELLSIARENGSILLYSISPFDLMEAQAAAFTEETGIPVDMWRASEAGGVLTRASTEYDAGRLRADVLQTNESNMSLFASETEILTPFVTVHDDNIDPAARTSDIYYPSAQNFWVWAYNTELLSEEDLPHTYEDLLDPRWQGEISIANYGDWFHTMWNYFDEQGVGGQEYFEQLATQDVFVGAAFTPAVLPVVSGERSFVMGITPGLLGAQKAAGAPIEGYYPDEPTVTRPASVGFHGGGANPEGGMLYIDWLLGPEGQAVQAEFERIPANSTVGVPEGMIGTPEIEPLQINYDDYLPNQQEWDTRWQQIFGAS